ncbi:MAG: hypothetical protein LIR50_21085 [Bacillota bacterium]|nr:hypothetical protein [Bacillota bacterium]
MGGNITIAIFVLVVTCEVFLFKNILVNYKGCSRLKIGLQILFAVSAVLCSAMLLLEVYSFSENSEIISTAANLNQDMILSLKNETLIDKRNIIISVISCSISFLLSYLVFISMKREWKKIKQT